MEDHFSCYSRTSLCSFSTFFARKMARFCLPAMVGVALIAALVTTEIQAKSGCANFGHSCYGGIGKRGDSENNNEEIAQNTIQEAENSPYGFPGGRSQSAGVTNLPRPLGYNRLPQEQSEQINRYVREWIINYLRREEQLEQK